MRVLTVSTLFPDAIRPNFGVFVEQQMRGLAAEPGVEVTVVAPVGLPRWPRPQLARYRALAGLPEMETWRGLTVHRPRFHRAAGNGPAVLSLGALIPRKGHDVVIEAVAALPGVTLLIAGEGP